jgi:hypothetical protein
MAVIDTNVFIYAILEDSEFHREARRILSSIKKWTVPSIVIYELWWFLRFEGFSSDKIELATSSILNSPRSRIIGDNGKYTRRALEFVREVSPKRFNDMIILAVAEEHGSLVSYDRRLRQKAKELSIKILPEVPSQQ